MIDRPLPTPPSAADIAHAKTLITPRRMMNSVGESNLPRGTHRPTWRARLAGLLLLFSARLDPKPINWLSQGPHWTIDCRTSYTHAASHQLIDTWTEKPITGIHAVAANAEAGLILCYSLDALGRKIIGKDGVEYVIRHMHFRIERKSVAK